ncbi:type II toxin-antitoxin system RelE/ParE family toxin [Bifidobacterium parmae]|uniref:Killer protein n=1 Tax=Bifidobacterium parmae TaxID=361854 RepID=A0A2N5J583_9BIFI|nr:type II toxin-antitoxin system RelE/ParE family toxin [Bifidobacterium parmae]PLS29372.1 Killer protein [Bifidobacterium parmae]
MYIQTRDKKLKDFLFGGEYPKGYPIECENQLTRRLQMLKAADSLQALRSPPSNHLERLTGNLKGYWSIRVNRQYRLVFKWDGDEKEAYDVYFDDYHG